MKIIVSLVIVAAVVGGTSFARMFGVRITLPAIKKLDAAVFAALFAACAVIAQKGTNDPPRGASAPCPEAVPGNGGDAIAASPQVPQCGDGVSPSILITPDPGTGPFTDVAPFEVSNLCFTAISATPTSVWLSASWPYGFSPTNALLDIYARGTLSPDDSWRVAAHLPVAPGSTNAVFELQKCFLPANGASDSCFVSVATQDDSDGDGLADAFENLVTGTAPLLADSDGDGVGDYAEFLLGSDPTDGGTPVCADGRRMSSLLLAGRFSGTISDFGTNVVFERTIPVDPKGGWVQFFVSASPTNAAPWSLSGATLEWSDSAGGRGSVPASPPGDSWRIPVSSSSVSSVTLRLVAMSPGFGVSAPLVLVSYSPDAYVSGCAWNRDEGGLDRFAYAGALPHSFSVEIDRSDRPCNAPLSADEANASPFCGSPAISYNPASQTLSVSSPCVAAVRSSLGSDGVIAMMNPLLKYGERCGWRGMLVEYNAIAGTYSAASPYPLDAPCLVESWNATTNGSRHCTCVPDLTTGIEGSEPDWIETDLGYNGSEAEADVLFCGNSIWHGEADHPSPGTEEDSQSDFLSDDGCGCSSGCESGNCDDLEGPSLGSVRFRIPLGVPRKGQVSGFAWFELESTQPVRSDTFSVLSRDDAMVSDAFTNGMRVVTCSDARGRTLEIADNTTGVCITVRTSATLELEHTWDIVNCSGGDLRFVKTSRLGNTMDDRTYSCSGGDWTETDNITGLAVTSRKVDTLGLPNGALVEERITVDGATTNAHIMTRSELVGTGPNAVLRETMCKEMSSAGWRTACASYWNDESHPQRHGKPRCAWGDSRAWEYRNYDSEGRLVAVVEQFDGSQFPSSLLNGEITSPADIPPGVVCRAEFRSYEPHAGDAQMRADECEPRTMESYVSYGGEPIKTGARWRTISRGTYNGWPTVSVLEQVAASQNAEFGDSGNRVTQIVSFDPDSPVVPLVAHGMTAFEIDEDGIATSNSFSFVNGALRVETRTVAPSGAIAPVLRAAEYDPVHGNLLYEADALSTNGVEFGWRRHVYDEKNRLRFTQYDDGSSETNSYSCCRLLSSTDRTGATTLRSATTGRDRLYYAEEEVSLVELPHHDWYAAWDYTVGGGGWSGVPITYRVTQHFMDASGRETNTVVRGAKTPGVAVDPDFTLRFGMRSSKTTSYPHGFSDYSVSTDKRGVATVFAERAYADREETETLVYHPTNLTEWVSRTLAVRRRNGGSAVCTSYAPGFCGVTGCSGGVSPSQCCAATTNRSESCYAPDGSSIEYAVTESSDCGIVTNSVTYRDFLGRVSRRITPTSDVSYSYSGASSRETSETDAASGLATARLYDQFGEERGTVSRGVASTREVTYEYASNAWWRVTTDTTSAGDSQLPASVARERLTGLSDELRGETVNLLGDEITLRTKSWFDPATKVLTEITESATVGTATNMMKFGRLVRTVDPGGTTSRTFDPYGYEFITEKDGRDVSFVMRNGNDDIDAFGRFRGYHDYSTQVELFAYDAFGNRVVTTNELEDVTTSVYDYDGRLLETGGAVYPVRHSYDTQGRRTSLSTTRDGTTWDTTSWAYDPVTGLCASKTYADNSTVSYTYTADGLPLHTTYASGRWKENSYNAKRELASVEYSDGEADFFEYDAFSHEVAASNSVASIMSMRDSRGSVTNEIATAGGDARTVVREYDAYGRLLCVDGSIYTYAPDGQIAAISNDLAFVEYSYTPDRLDAGYTIALINGLVYSRSLARHDYLRSQVMSVVSSTNGAPVESFAYSYDALGRPISRNADTFGYNTRSEVTSHIPAGYWPQSYAYDEIGNSTWYFANNLNQYTEFGYDLDGNMITNYNTVMSYDAQSRLSSISTLVYTNNEWHTELLISNCYDHIGRRVKKITPAATHTFFYDGWNLIEERVAHTSGANTIIRYYWGKDLSGTLQGAGGVGGLLYLTVSTSNVEHQTSNSQLFIPCYDNNGNITRYLDSNGATVAQYTYDAFGNLLDKSGPLCDLFRQLFSTKYFDRETDLCYYGCRYYSPALMRWINRDPIGGQDSEANPYLFINNQATFDTDYLGMNSNTKMEATANQWHPLGTSTHEYHVWNCSEWPTYDGKQGGTYEKYVQHFSRVTFTMFYKVPADYKLYFAYGIPTTLEMDKKQSSYWCLDLKPFSVYWRHNNRKNAKEYKVTFTVTNFDRHPCLREHPNYLQSKFIGKTISYGPKP